MKTRFTLFLGLFLCFTYTNLFSRTYYITNGNVAGLIAAIQDANANQENNTIFLAINGIYTIQKADFVGAEGYVNNGTEGPIAFPRIENSSKLTIDGRGATIKRAATAPLFRFFLTSFRANFELKNITLEGAKSNKGGAALFISFKSQVSLENCNFKNNESINDYGGAVKIRSRSSVKLNNCHFINNKSLLNGGGLYNTLSDLEITNSTFIENSTTRSGGGAYLDGARGDNGHIKIENCRFEKNSAGLTSGSGSAGGGLYLYLYNRNTGLVNQCNFEENQANGDRSYAGGLDCTNGTIISNDTDYPYTGGENNTFSLITNSAFIRNQATYIGGGILFGNGAGNLINCTVAYNKVMKEGQFEGVAGGIYANGMQLTINHCTIAYNEVGRQGGGIAVANPKINNITINNSIIAFNTAQNGGNSTTIKNNCRQIFQGVNNIEFPDVLDWNTNDNYCTPSVTIANPRLGLLQDNGGPTFTIALLPNSPAINAANPAFSSPTDQRGMPRQGTSDIGAFEFVPGGITLPDPDDIYLEAECAALGSNWNVIEDAQASEGEYVSIKPRLNNFSATNATGANNRVRFTFTVGSSNIYSIYARVLAPSYTDDSFYISIDDGTPITWNNLHSPDETGFKWKQVLEQNFNLSIGQHTLDVYYREDGTGLDKLFIGKANTFPSELGLDAVCGTVPVLPRPFSIYLEAECAEVGSVWDTVNNTEASNGQFTEVRGLNNFNISNATGANNRIRFSFSVPKTESYAVYARVRTPSYTDDSFYISTDGGSPQRWNDLHTPGQNNYHWIQLLNTDFALGEGLHTIDFYYREDGAELDKLFVGELGLTPDGLGDDASNCFQQKTVQNSTVMSSTTMISESPKWSLYPNPVGSQNIIMLSYTGNTSSQEKVRYVIQDRMGRIILKGEQIIKENQIQINLSNQIIAAGSYILHIGSDKRIPKSIHFIKY